LSEIITASESERLIMADCEALRLHYVHTLRAWYDRFKAKEDEVISRYGQAFYRMWSFYLAASVTMFSDGAMIVYQLQYLRSRDAVPMTRDYMFEDERKLRLVAQPMVRPPSLTSSVPVT
jgi:cyclopropane-fatty-acyl-phospholipid synthase